MKPPPSNTGDILIVDDNPENLKTLRMILLREGHRVRTAIDGDLALRSAADKAPDLIVLDIRMRGMDGYEVCRRLKADDGLADIPVIFISALTETGDKVKAFDVGGVDYISKPFQAGEVLSRVRTHLKLHCYEKELKRRARFSEERYHAVVEDTPLAICRFLPDGEITFENSAFRDWFAGPAGETPIRNFLELIPETDRQGVMSGVASLTPASPMQTHEHPMTAPDDDARWHRWTTRALFDNRGETIGFQSIGEDVTERKRLEKELHTTQMHYTDFINASVDPVSYWRAPAGLKTDLPIEVQIEMLYEVVCIDSNIACCEAVGLKSKDEIIGKTYTELLREKTLDRTFTDFINSNYRLVDYQNLEKAKHREDYYGLECWFGVVENGMLTHVWAVSKDITELKKVELALKESEEKYRGIFNNASEGIFQSTKEGRLLSANPALARMFGFDSPRELMDYVRNIPAQIYVDPGRREELFRRVEMDGAVKGFEAELRRKDGSIASVSINAHAVRDESGGLRFLEGAAEDVTALKKAEAENKKIEARLQRAQKLEAIGTLAGGIAHDFNNILSLIVGFAELVKEDLPDHDPEPLENLNEIIRAGLRARDLVRQIVTFSRHSEIEKGMVNITPLIKEAVKFLRASLPASIEIRTEGTERAAVVYGDISQMHQVVMNLCTNAIHAMKEKGGVLGIRLKKEVLDEDDIRRYEGMSPGDCIVLTASDTGHGIPGEIIDRVFDPFFTTKKRGEGTGMGLSVVHGIVREMKGAIHVESEPGKGTVVRVTLPTGAGATERDIAVGESRVQKGGGRVLFVDDEERIGLATGKMLERLGYDVTRMTESPAALGLFLSDPRAFDLVITDLNMPELDGVELSRQMLAVRPELPVVLCTGFARDITRRDLEKIGVCGMLMKPVLASELAVVVKSAMKTNHHLGGKRGHDPDHRR